MHIPVVQVDAFASRHFEGNPAAVCPLEAPLSAAQMQRVARENNLSETAFTVPRPDGAYDLRWFTPTVEVSLCGHATLAAAHVLLGDADGVRFHTASGQLEVRRDGERLVMDFPALPPGEPVDDPDIVRRLGVPIVGLWRIREVHGARYLLAEVDEAATVRAMAVPDLGRTNVIVTARGDEAGLDFVSRFFAPGSGVPEDPVTGSAHCTLAPFWAARLGETELRARQVSPRGGDVGCAVRGDRVLLSGRAVTVLTGTLRLGPAAPAVDEARAEIERLHAFFVDWFAGRVPDDEATFASGCADRIDDGFVLVEPSGAVLGKEALLGGIRAGHGGNPGFRITVEEVRVVADEGGLLVVSYVERQAGAKRSSPASNARRSVATLRRGQGGLRWVHVQETWLGA